MLRGHLANGTAFSINHFKISCEDPQFETILNRLSSKFQNTQYMASAYEAETMLGEHFVAQLGGKITQPSDQDNFTNWGVRPNMIGMPPPYIEQASGLEIR